MCLAERAGFCDLVIESVFLIDLIRKTNQRREKLWKVILMVTKMKLRLLWRYISAVRRLPIWRI